MKKSSLILIAASGFSLVACNSGDGSSGSSTTPTSGLTTSFASGNSFNATMDDPTANKILTLANTGESNISDITFTLPTNNYFTLTNDDTGVKPCTIGTDNTLTNALESNQSCTVKVTYSNATTTSSASTNIVFDYLYGQSNKTLNTPITYQTTSSTSPTNSWVYVGNKMADLSTPRPIVYDKPTNSIYQISDGGTDICSISANADETTPWTCTPTFSGFSIYGTSLTTDGNGHLFTIAQKPIITSDGQLYLQTYSTVSKTVSSTKMVLQTESGVCVQCLDYSNYGGKPLAYSGGNVFYVENNSNLMKINAITAVTTRTKNAFTPEVIGGPYAIDNNSNIYYSLSSDVRYVNVNTTGNATSSILGTSNTGYNGITIAGNNLYGCAYSGAYYIPLGSSSTTQWNSLPPTSQYLNVTNTGCNQITSSSNYLYVTSLVYNSNSNNNYAIEARLLKYKY